MLAARNLLSRVGAGGDRNGGRNGRRARASVASAGAERLPVARRPARHDADEFRPIAPAPRDAESYRDRA